MLKSSGFERVVTEVFETWESHGQSGLRRSTRAAGGRDQSEGLCGSCDVAASL